MQVEPIVGSELGRHDESTEPIKSLLKALAEHVRDDPQGVACFRVGQAGQDLVEHGITYEELVHKSMQFMQAFKRLGLRAGDRLLLSLSDPHRVLQCMIGAMASGMVTVPLQTVGEFVSMGAFVDRMRGVATDCNPRLVVVESRSQWDGAMQGVDLGAMVVELSELDAQEVDEDVDLASLPARDPDEWAFIQYTSGSSGNPKGVIITHENLASNVKAIGTVTNTTSDDRVVSWLPLHHDMGIIGALLFAVYWGIPTFIMSPMTFLSRPVNWLRAIDQFKGTMTVAPTFAYSISLRKIPDEQLEGLDLSTCRVAFCGAEPIGADLVTGFMERFGRYGFRKTSFYPVYGLAEATLAASFPRYGEEPVFDHVDRGPLSREGIAVPIDPSSPEAIKLVSVGRAMPDHKVRIVDTETFEELPDRRVGEILVKGPSISPYYYNALGFVPEKRAELRTGDLGYLNKGRLFVFDRLKDLVILAGRNFAPSDLEYCVFSTMGLRLGRVVAFSLQGEDGNEELHFVAEIDIRSWRSQKAIRREVIRRIGRHFGLKVKSVTLVPPGSIPRTSSGKLKRAACRREFVDGKYPNALSTGIRLGMKWKLLKHLIIPFG